MISQIILSKCLQTGTRMFVLTVAYKHGTLREGTYIFSKLADKSCGNKKEKKNSCISLQEKGGKWFTIKEK